MQIFYILKKSKGLWKDICVTIKLMSIFFIRLKVEWVQRTPHLLIHSGTENSAGPVRELCKYLPIQCVYHNLWEQYSNLNNCSRIKCPDKVNNLE